MNVSISFEEFKPTILISSEKSNFELKLSNLAYQLPKYLAFTECVENNVYSFIEIAHYHEGSWTLQNNGEKIIFQFTVAEKASFSFAITHHEGLKMLRG